MPPTQPTSVLHVTSREGVVRNSRLIVAQRACQLHASHLVLGIVSPPVVVVVAVITPTEGILPRQNVGAAWYHGLQADQASTNIIART